MSNFSKVGLKAGTELVGKVGIDQATANANEVVVKSITAGNNNIGDVDIASIAAGTNLIGKVGIDQATANANEVVVKSITAGNNNIGNVDVLSADITKIAGESIQVSGGTEEKSIRVTIATDSTGLISVDDNNSSLTVDGSVTTTRTSLVASAPTYATVGDTSAEAVAANANRKGLVLINTSANYISVGIGAAAVLYSGITLTPWGTWEMDEYTFTTGQIRAIASSAGSNLAVQEYT